MNRKVMDWTKCSAKHGKVFVPYNAPVYDPEANGSAVVAWYEENAPHKLGDVAKWIRRSHDLELQARAKYEYDKALKGDKIEPTPEELSAEIAKIFAEDVANGTMLATTGMLGVEAGRRVQASRPNDGRPETLSKDEHKILRSAYRAACRIDDETETETEDE